MKEVYLVQSRETSCGFGSVSKHKPYATEGVIDPSIALKFHVGKGLNSPSHVLSPNKKGKDANKIQKKREILGHESGFQPTDTVWTEPYAALLERKPVEHLQLPS